MTGILLHLFRHRLSTTIASRLSASAAGLLVGIALARALGPAGLGGYANLVATASIAGTLLCLGMEIPYNLRAARTPDAGANLLLMVSAQAALSVPASAAIWFALYLAGLAPVSSPPLFILITAAFVLNQLTQPVMSGIQKQAWTNIVMACLLLTQAAAVTTLAYYALARLPVIVAVYIGTLIALYLLALATQSRTRNVNFPYRRAASEAFAEGRHYMLATLSGIIRLRASIVIMGWYLPTREIGNYQIMQTMTEVLYLVPVTVSTYIISSQKEGRTLSREVLAASLASCLLTLVCVIGLSAVLPLLVPFFYGAGFEKVIGLGPIMLSGAIAFSIAKGISAYFSRLRLAHVVTKVELITTAIALSAAAILIPVAGLEGAVWGFVLASWAGALGYVIHLMKFRAERADRLRIES